MNIVGFIFARGGSKGLPGKNVRLLSGKPLIAWSIEQAKAVGRIQRVIVSTDSEEIAAVAREYRAEVPFMRPSKLANDNSPEWLAWRHALSYLEESEGALPDIMISIPATAPLRLPVDVESCLNEYLKGGADLVITMTDAHRNPYFNMLKKKWGWHCRARNFLASWQPLAPPGCAGCLRYGNCGLCGKSSFRTQAQISF